MQFIDKDKLIEVLELADKNSLDINDLNGILETYGDTYYISNSEWELCKEEKKLETNLKVTNKKSWEEFRKTGLLWFINTTLHMFGWAITLNVKEDGSIINGFPARVKFRGFPEEDNTEGYIKVSKYMKENAEQLLKESEE